MKYDTTKRYEAVDLSRTDNADEGHIMYFSWDERQGLWFGRFCFFATLPAALRRLREYYGKAVVIREATE